MSLPPVQLDSIICGGGLDQVTPTLALKNGIARHAVNFEAAVTGGYTRIAGYERFDGQSAPSAHGPTAQYLTVLSPSRVVAVGTQVIEKPSNYAGMVAAVDSTGSRIIITTADFSNRQYTAGSELWQSGFLIGTIYSNDGPVDTYEQSTAQAAVADYFRTQIDAVPGVGPILGVAYYDNKVYAWRDNVGNTFKECYVSSGTGWSHVAALDSPLGGIVRTEVANFSGQSATEYLYIVDGVGPAREWTGVAANVITTGMTTDTPEYVAAHRNYLFLAFASSVLHSGPGLPLNFSALDGANEIATGAVITDMVVMPGGTGQSTLAILSRTNTSILYGTGPSDWNLVQYNTGCGANPGSAKNMAQTLMFDDRGAVTIQAALQYGNFDQSTITTQVLPFVNAHVGLFTAATLCRRKSQYRIFFADGQGLYMTVVNGKPLGCMPVFFPHVVLCAVESKMSDGTDVMFFGSDDGYVYQMDKGTSFDGVDIEFALGLNYTHAKSPRLLKRFRKVSIEVFTEIATHVTFDFGALLGYDPANYEQPLSISYSDYLASDRWDEFTWDQFFWDSRNTAPVECEITGTAESVSMLINGVSKYLEPFTINSILVHYTPRRMMR
jgi:hypothetical protein